VISLNEQQLAFLQQHGFDAAEFDRWQAALASGSMSIANNAERDELLAPPPGTVQKLPLSSNKALAELEALGRAAIARGELGVVVLNGGMATRFGGVVKGIVPVLSRHRTFLALCVEDVLRAEQRTGGKVPLYLMNSFATDAATREHFDLHEQFGAEPERIHHFQQFVSLRMQPDGQLFRLQNGEISPYGPGHGDFPAAMRRSGCLQQFLRDGGRYLLVKNVDNLGARVDPAILGHHIQSGRSMTVELAPKWPEDQGGSPFLLRDRTQLVEQLRYPLDLDPNTVDVFNTNTFLFTAAALDRDFELGWYVVEKQVEGRRAVQIEHLIGELTAHLDTNFLQVRRQGRHSRFLPIKTPEDLEAARDEIADMYDSDGEDDNTPW